MRKIKKDLIEASIELADKGQSKLGEREKEIFGLSSTRLRALLNNLCSIKDTKYLEIGVYKGSTLLSAMYSNPTLTAVGIENYSYDEREPLKFAPEGNYWTNVQSQLKTNIQKYDYYPEQVDTSKLTIVEEDYKTVDLKESGFDLCFFDIAPIQPDTYTAFFDNILPKMNKECTIVFSNYSNEKCADQLDQALLDAKDKFAVINKTHKVSGGLSDATEYYSGVLIVSLLISDKAQKTQKGK